MRTRSIRFRLTVWYSLALTAGLTIFGLATWLSVRRGLLDDLTQSLAFRAQSAQNFVLSELADPKAVLEEELDEYSHGLPHGCDLRVRTARGNVIFTSNLKFPWPPDAAPYGTRIEWNRHSYLLLSEAKQIKGEAWEFMTTAPLDDADRLLNRLRLFLLTLLPAIIAAALAGGAWLSRRALKPVDELTAAARSISLENLSERLPVLPTGDELQRLAETWNSMLSRMEQALGRRSRFTADASHELRTPVAVIRTTAELAARRDRPAESYRQALVQIVDEAERMTRLLDDLLFLSRMDSEPVELPKEMVDLAALISQVCLQVQPLAEAKQLQLKFPSAREAMEIAANEPAVRRLILVLLDNAVKYSRPGGEISVSLHRDAATLTLEVSDSGPGVQAEERTHIFERFYRSPQARQTSPEGSGLGLSLASGIAHMHNAEISVIRSCDQGATFSVVFQSFG